MAKQYQLSKSSFIKGLQCKKQLYLYKHHYDWMDPVSEQQQAIFDRGHNVGILAQNLFPGGVDASTDSPREYEKGIKQTEEFIKAGKTIIYEAAFRYNDVLVISDIIVKENGKWKVYEVKSSTSVSEVYLMDASIQYYVLSNLGYDIEDISIVYINNQYIRQGELDLQSLFAVQSVLDEALANQEFIAEKVKEFQALLREPNIPDIDIGTHCTDPYNCSFMGYCWKDVPDYSVFDIARLRKAQKFDLYYQGIVDFKDIPNDAPLGYKQWQQVNSELNNETIINKEAIKEFIDDLEYPLHYLDFETFMPAVPLFDNSRPYQQIPFQYSLHIKRSPEGELEHFEFLAEASGDPREEFIKNLIIDVQPSGDILVYNQTFEKTRLKELAADFPQYEEEIYNIIARIKDLMIPFRERWYYTPEMKGSYSIKYVLPALVSGLSYEELNIQEGGSAMNAFESLYFETDMIKIDQTRKDLLEYCKMDTLAMVEILNALNSSKII